MLTRRIILNRFRAVATSMALLLFTTAGSWAQQTASDYYTVTLPNKRLLALPPFATESLPKSLTFRVRVQVQNDDSRQTVRLLTLPMSGDTPTVTLDATLVADQDGTVRQCEVRYGTRAVGKPPYRAELRVVRPTDSDDFTLTLPAKTGNSPASGFVLHPLTAQLLLGRQYDFNRGGRQTFAVVQEWSGDALNPATDLATLVLEADGTETLTLTQGRVKARRLRYTFSNPLSTKEKSGTFFIGPKGELLQSTSALWGIPLDGGKATGSAIQEGDQIILKTTSGETIKGRPRGEGYTVELYGKYDAPFVVASVDGAGRLRQVAERWNGREKTSLVAANEVRYRFSEGKLTTFIAPSSRVGFAPLWFATALWEAEGSKGAALMLGASQKAAWAPLWLEGEYCQNATLTRLPDVVRKTNTLPAYRHYRWNVEDRVQYDLYTDGARLVLMRGSDGLIIVRDDTKAFGAEIAAQELAALETPRIN